MTVSGTRQADLIERAHAALGGTLGLFHLPDDVAFVVDRAEGPYLYSVDGRRYIDYLLGSGPMLLGHAHPEIIAAVQQQAARGLSFYTLSEPVIQLAERIIEIVPCAEMVKFTSSGTEATFYAMRIARAFTGKPKILKFEGGFHGMHDYALMSVSAPVQTQYPTPIPDSGGIPEQIESDVIISRWNDIELTEHLIRKHAGEIAAVICEPLQRALLPAPGFLKELRRITFENDVLLIFDEIVTGFRLAMGGAQEKYGVVPDLAAFGKALTAGYPMACVAGRREIMQTTHPSRASGRDYARLGGTMSGNPVGAAAGLKSLELLSQPGTYERLYETTDRLRNAIRAIGAERGVPVQALGEGPVFQVLFSEGPVGDYPAFLAADRVRSHRFGIECVRRGVSTNPGEKFYVSLAHSDEDIVETNRVFEEAFDAVLMS